MGLLSRYDPPALLTDLDEIQGQRRLWHEFIQEQMGTYVDALAHDMSGHPGATPQFYDATRLDPGATIEQDIVWNAFPKELLRRFGRRRALFEADRPWPLPAYQLGWRFEPPDLMVDERMPAGVTFSREHFYRPQNEYCEWRVELDAKKRLQRVTFTCEPPEYWQAIAGWKVPNSQIEFEGDKCLLLDRYRKLVDPSVQAADLLVTKEFAYGGGPLFVGDYNVLNMWNTTHGIMHLCSPPNSLIAEIKLASESTQVFKNAHGDTIVRPDVLMAVSNLGGANRNSDTAIAATINALARLGKRITLANPVGLYMDHVDLSGWEMPRGVLAEDCVHVVRGHGRSIQRLVVELPKASGRDLSDVRIGGEPLAFGGQIAECITMRLTGVASVAGGIVNPRVAMRASGFVQPEGGSEVFVAERRGAPPGTVRAFLAETGQGEAIAADTPKPRLPQRMRMVNIR